MSWLLSGLAGHVAVVTGASGSIGSTCVSAFTAEGTDVVAVDLPEKAGTGRAAAEEAAHPGPGRAIFVPADIISECGWKTITSRAVSEFGRLDILVNNAAVYRNLGAKKPLAELGAFDWDLVLTVNVRGAGQGIKAVAPVMAAGEGGAIINVSSAAARAGTPGLGHYAASKGAVETLTRVAARELGPDGIRVNAIAPGLVDDEASRALNDEKYFAQVTQARALGKPIRPGDLAGTVLWLASPASGPVTGQVIVADGGQVFS